MESDWRNPQWDKAGSVHDWRNYISDRLKILWETFNDEQKQAIQENAEDQAAREEWD